jgi:non-homologous end joining protein Ku
MDGDLLKDLLGAAYQNGCVSVSAQDGRVVLSRRERIVMLEPFEKGLMVTTFRYAYEIRDAAPYFEDIPAISCRAK